MKPILFPLIIYKDQIAYSLGVNDTWGGYKGKVFDDFISPYGFESVVDVGDLSQYTAIKLGIPKTFKKGVGYIHPKGVYIRVRMDAEILTTHEIIGKEGYYLSTDYACHDDFIIGSLDYTQSLLRTVKVIRENFRIPKDKIIVEPLVDFLKRVEERMNVLYPDDDRSGLDNAPYQFPFK